MTNRARHKIERLKKLAWPQKADDLYIPVHTEYVPDDLQTDDETIKDAEVFKVDVTIVIKQAE